MKKLLLFPLALLLASCTQEKGPMTITLSSADTLQTVDVIVEIADSDEERAQGLMNRAELAADHGMLFVFDEEDVRNFWMKNTQLPLDILFFDEEGRFVAGHTMEPCEKDPCPQYSSFEPAMFALEMNAGFREEKGIRTGWTLDVSQ